MGTKVTSSSGSVLEEPEIQKLQMQAKIFKENSLNKLNALKSTTQLLERQTFSGCILYQQAFAQLFGDSVRTFKFQLSQHMNNLETLLNAETLHEMDSKSALTQSVKFQTFHMLAPKCATYNGRSTFANPKYLKIAQFEKPRLYEILYDTSDPANRFCPNGEETLTLEKESRSKLDKDKNYLSRLNPRASQDEDAKSIRTTIDDICQLKSGSQGKVTQLLHGGKVDSEPTHVSRVDIPHIHACKQTLGLSARTSFNGQKQQRIELNADALYNEKQENLRVWLLNNTDSRKTSARMVSQKMNNLQKNKTFDHSRSSLGLQWQ
ncbi:hypothetical protein Tco_0669113 [Tanacetum coccineum]